jgi:quinol monooxygenase YgiN
MAKFMQIIEFETDKIDEIQALDEEWQKATEGKRTATRAIITADKDKPGTYLVIVEFPSYEDAQKNNELPATAEFASKQAALTKGESKFRNLEVVDDQKL